MNRYEFEDLISDYIENNLSLSKRKEVEQYLNENPESQLLINEISSNMEKVKSVPQLSVDDNFNQTLKSKLMKKIIKNTLKVVMIRNLFLDSLLINLYSSQG